MVPVGDFTIIFDFQVRFLPFVCMPISSFTDGRGAGMVERSKQRVRSVSPPRNLTPEEKVAKQHALAAEGKVEEIVPGIESW